MLKIALCPFPRATGRSYIMGGTSFSLFFFNTPAYLFTGRAQDWLADIKRKRRTPT